MANAEGGGAMIVETAEGTGAMIAGTAETAGAEAEVEDGGAAEAAIADAEPRSLRNPPMGEVQGTAGTIVPAVFRSDLS